MTKPAKLFIANRLATHLKASENTSERQPVGAGSQSRPVPPLAALLATALALSGCAVQGAPSYTLFGAYFPAWMFCAAIGLVAAIVARAFFEATGLSYVLPYQLFVCASIGVCAGLAAGFLWFEP